MELHPRVYRRAAEAVVFTAAVAAFPAASVVVVVVSTEVAALAEAVFTPADLMAAISAARRLAGTDSGPASGRDSGPA